MREKERERKDIRLSTTAVLPTKACTSVRKKMNNYYSWSQLLLCRAGIATVEVAVSSSYSREVWLKMHILVKKELKIINLKANPLESLNVKLKITLICSKK